MKSEKTRHIGNLTIKFFLFYKQEPQWRVGEPYTATTAHSGHTLLWDAFVAHQEAELCWHENITPKLISQVLNGVEVRSAGRLFSD